jgi:hypothetical protein
MFRKLILLPSVGKNGEEENPFGSMVELVSDGNKIEL